MNTSKFKLCISNGCLYNGTCPIEAVLALRYDSVDHPTVPIFVYARFHCKTKLLATG